MIAHSLTTFQEFAQGIKSNKKNQVEFFKIMIACSEDNFRRLSKKSSMTLRLLEDFVIMTTVSSIIVKAEQKT